MKFQGQEVKGRGDLDPVLLPCLSGGRGRLQNQSRHPCRTVWARPGHICTSLSCTCPLCPLPSFLTDAEGHTGWDDSGRGGFVFACGFRRPLSSGALCAVHPPPISAPFLAATPGLQAGTEGTEVGTFPVLGLTVCPQSPRSPFPPRLCTLGSHPCRLRFLGCSSDALGRLRPLGARKGEKPGYFALSLSTLGRV